jgi:hypothetical protein
MKDFDKEYLIDVVVDTRLLVIENTPRLLVIENTLSEQYKELSYKRLSNYTVDGLCNIIRRRLHKYPDECKEYAWLLRLLGK